MTPDELSECLETIRWPGETLAKALGCDLDEVRQWLTGAKPIPIKTAAWIKTLAMAHAAVEAEKPGRRR